jgi:hypothetical protein
MNRKVFLCIVPCIAFFLSSACTPKDQVRAKSGGHLDQPAPIEKQPADQKVAERVDERTMFETVQAQDTADAYRNYLKEFPKGEYSAYANQRIDQLAFQGQFLDFLEKEQYRALNGVLDALQQKYKAQPGNLETSLMMAYTTFMVPDTSLGKKLDAWVDATPDSYPAYLARGAHFIRIARDARGASWRKDVSPDRVAKMNKYFELALSDTEKAIALNEDTIVPYSYLMLIVQIRSRESDYRGGFQGLYDSLSEVLTNHPPPHPPSRNAALKSLYLEALERSPYSLDIRVSYMSVARPRWGGSVEEMQSVLDDSKPYWEINPHLESLQDMFEQYVYEYRRDRNRFP